MEKWRCCNCGCVFDPDDAKTYQECVGEFWGTPAYETFCCCPECGSDELEDYVEEEDWEDYEEDE